MLYKLLRFLNNCFPKFNQVVVEGNANVVEANGIEVANYIAKNYKIPVFYISYNSNFEKAKSLLVPEVKLLEHPGFFSAIKLLTSKYFFSTHRNELEFFSAKQIKINLWHGIYYKRIGKLNGRSGVAADVTVGTSLLTQKMFSEAFGVPLNKVVICGYPRNDIMLRSKNEKSVLKEKLENLGSFSKILIWLPTYRESIFKNMHKSGVLVDNPFQVEGFDAVYFNELLKGYNTLCFVKPHGLALKNNNFNSLSNLHVIDDAWMASHGLTLYHFLACSDMLISDVSSVIIDYLLLDQPVICFSSDFEEYKRTRGFYFANMEDWLPGRLIYNQNDFFDHLKLLLVTGKDPDEQKRMKLKDAFFSFKDANSTERLVKHVFNMNN
jgi:CDP-glycerol glycerophosphotransferase (TagB/SpsB family)